MTNTAKPMLQLDPEGSPVILSYDLPEPTTYRGRYIIQYNFDDDHFRRNTQNTPTANSSEELPPLEQVDLDENLISGDENLIPRDKDSILIFNRPEREISVQNGSTIKSNIEDAYEVAKRSGYFDPKIFPNVCSGNDKLSIEGMRAVLDTLPKETVVKQLTNGRRLTIYRDSTGSFNYYFIRSSPEPKPVILLVEYYQLSSFLGRYGAGRTIKTFSLLPGEKTRIAIRSYRRTEVDTLRTSSIVDSTHDETERDFMSTVLREQSSEEKIDSNFEYHAEAEAQTSASWGWGDGSLDVSGGISGSTNAAREEFAKNMSTATTHNTARASSRRDIQVDTSLDYKRTEEVEESTERDLENLNVSRTLNFVFRQLNQEYVTFLHLVDVRVAFFNGFVESKFEVPLSQLNLLLERYIQADKIQAVKEQILKDLRAIRDYKHVEAKDFVQEVTLKKSENDPMPHTYYQINPGYSSTDTDSGFSVPGVIISKDVHVLRTDGVLVDSFLGQGNALDTYSENLQGEEIRAERTANELKATEVAIQNLANSILQDGNLDQSEKKATLYQTLFNPES